MINRVLMTQAQERVLGIIRDFIAQHGYPPTIREISVVAGRTKNAIHRHITALARKGFISRKRGARTIQVLDGKPTMRDCGGHGEGICSQCGSETDLDGVCRSKVPIVKPTYAQLEARIAELQAENAAMTSRLSTWQLLDLERDTVIERT